MKKTALKLCLLVLSGLIFWVSISYGAGAIEPWDSQSYFTLWYPLSILLAAFGGYLLGARGWMSGLAVTFAQLPIVVINNGADSDSLIAAGVLYLVVMAVPPIIISALAGRYLTDRD